MNNKTLKLREIIEMMETEDPRSPLQQQFDAAKMALITLSDTYDSNGNNGARTLIDELIEKLQIIYKNNRVV